MNEITLAQEYLFDDFTESHYRDLLTMAIEHYSFESFGTKSLQPHILWRHDVDLSVHRAIRLAEIEALKNIKATYFFLLHSEFYNLLEKDNFSKAKAIIDMGHHLGLHFDIDFYTDIQTMSDLESKLSFEKNFLEDLFSQEINVFSFHNPTICDNFDLNRDQMAGMINTYGRSIMANYTYCSDSNGYWRYKRLYDLLQDKTIQKLQVLTHPGWWVPESMSPRERISRCINGRAKAIHQNYDDFLLKNNRDNIR